jgi:hypothetical protein
VDAVKAKIKVVEDYLCSECDEYICKCSECEDYLLEDKDKEIECIEDVDCFHKHFHTKCWIAKQAVTK